MASALRISIGQHSDQGPKEINQDFHGALLPEGRGLEVKGIASVIADGISSSSHGREAAETAVKSFLSDYYATPEGWTVKLSGNRVLSATNAWLFGQTRKGAGRYDTDKGYVCTFSALILKGRTAHILHVGDGRIYKLRDGALTQLTRDHRVSVGEGETVLNRALGISATLEIDYSTVQLAQGDIFLLATDGMADHLSGPQSLEFLGNNIASAEDLDHLAREAIARAVAAGANDNLTLQILRIEDLPDLATADLGTMADRLPVPHDPRVGQTVDSWQLVEQLHVSDRSRLFRAVHTQTGAVVALKLPGSAVADDNAFLQAFLMEEWVARRLDNPALMAAAQDDSRDSARSQLYTTFAFVEGQSLTRWMEKNPEPELAAVFSIVKDIAAGLQAMHRHQMVHQDLRPENVLITPEGKAVIIDFGSTRVLGHPEGQPRVSDQIHSAGVATHQYSPPEGLFGLPAEPTFDTYALGVIAYQMLTGDLPYGADMARASTPNAQRKVAYRPASGPDSRVPVWIDAALKKAVHVEPHWRYAEPSEFLADLSHPNPTLPGVRHKALLARDPVRFWQLVSLGLTAIIIALLYRVSSG